MESRVQAKFRCSCIVPGFSEGQKKVTLHAIYNGEGENADFAKATPCGNIDMLIDGSTKAVDFFEQGKDYYLDFTEAK
jgi:hypothetical protein